MPIINPITVKKAIDFGKKTAATFKAGKQAQQGIRPDRITAPRPVKRVAPRPAAPKPAPLPKPAPEPTFTIFGTKIKKSTVYIGGSLLALGVGTAIAYNVARR